MNTVPGHSLRVVFTIHATTAAAVCCPQLESRTWDELGRSTTVYHIPLLGNKVHWTIQSIAVPDDRGDIHNLFNLSHTQLAQRQLVHTSLTEDSLLSHSQSTQLAPPPSEDPKLFCSVHRPTPLGPSYAASCTAPFVCLYSLIDVRVSVWGVQALAEEYIGRELTAVWCRLLRLVWCWQDEWRGRSWQEECDRERSEARGGGSEDEGEKRVAADGWQRYVGEQRRGAGAASSGGFGLNDGQGGQLHGGGLTDGGGDKKWARRALTDAVSKWTMRSRL